MSMLKPLQRPYGFILNHANDDIKNIGYDYREHIFEKSVSKQLFANKQSEGILKEIQKLVYFTIEQVKLIKTRRFFAVDKDYNRFN